MPTLEALCEINPRFEREGNTDETPISFVPMAAVSEVSASVVIEEERPLGAVLKGFTPFRRDDVLVAKITPCFENGKIAQATIENELGFGSTEFHVLRPRPDTLDSRYLLHFLRQPHVRDQGERRMTGSGGQRRVPKAFLADLEIPLPPLPEQRRIAAILDKADALRAKRREAIAKLDQLLQSVFLDMFGDPVTNPKGWTLEPLGLHTRKIGSGATPKGGESSYKDDGVSLIRSMNVRDGMFLYKDLAYIDEVQARRLNNVIVEENDVLLNITGASVARVCRAPREVLPARVNQHVAIIRCADSVSPIYVERALLAAKPSLLRVAGAGATREAITKQQIEEFQIPIPDRNQQVKFAAMAKGIERQYSRSARDLIALDSLFASLQNHAFAATY